MDWKWAIGTALTVLALVFAYMQLRKEAPIPEAVRPSRSELTAANGFSGEKNLANGRRVWELTNSGNIDIFGLRVDGFGCSVANPPDPATVLRHGEKVEVTLAISTGNTAWFAVTWRTSASDPERPEVHWWPAIRGSDLGGHWQRQVRLDEPKRERLLRATGGHVAPNASVRGYAVGPQRTTHRRVPTRRARRSWQRKRSSILPPVQLPSPPSWSRARNPPLRRAKY